MSQRCARSASLGMSAGRSRAPRLLPRQISACLLGIALSMGCGSTPPAEPPRITQAIPWHGAGVWLKSDTHVHSRFSDGEYVIPELVRRAESFGCDVLAITDHLDFNLRGATSDYFELIREQREAHPNLIIFAGAEWNIPPWGGDEHATVLVHPEVEEQVLTRFKALFDDLGRPVHDPALADEALRWLAQHGAHDGVPPVVIYNHPSRKDVRSLANVDDFERWREVNDVVIGFEGAPGHQGSDPNGYYKYHLRTIDRWDPVVANVGDAWDLLLSRGHNAWAALATSDFHNLRELHDRWPGEFSESWLYVPQRTHTGVLKALRAGSFFAGHGKVARRARLAVSADGLERPAEAGETLEVPQAGMTVTCRVEFEPGSSADGGDPPPRVDELELIVIDAAGARVLASAAPIDGALEATLQVPAGGVTVRARGRHRVDDGPDLMFHTNPVRVKSTMGVGRAGSAN